MSARTAAHAVVTVAAALCLTCSEQQRSARIALYCIVQLALLLF
jgi:hypothetical protein